MVSLRSQRRFGPVVAPIVVAALLMAGCVKWRVATPTPDGVARSREARLTLKSGTTVQVTSPSVQGDSLVGFARFSSARVAYAVKDVAMVEVSKSDAAMTTMLILGGLVAILAASIIVCSLDDQGCGPSSL
jgi:hypothetical protein